MPNVIDKTPEEIKAWRDNDEAYLIDVREDYEMLSGRIPDTDLHIPLSRFEPSKIPSGIEKKIVFVCAQGVRSFQAAQYLLDNELITDAYNLKDGIAGWLNSGLTIESK